MDATAEQTIQLSEPPRELSKAILRRAWTEPRVRLWWVLAFGLLILTLYVVATQMSGWMTERRLIKEGTVVEAKILTADSPSVGNFVAGRPMPPDSDVDLEFVWTDGKKVKINGKLTGHIDTGRNVVVGQTVTLHVDPNDPQIWTSRSKPGPLSARVIVPALVGLPLVALLALLAVVRRRAVIAVYRDGEAANAMVVGTGQSPVAPLAKTLRCTPADSSDNRVFTVYLPASAGAIAQGEVVPVLHPPGKPEPAYAAAWFLRG